MKKGSKEMLRTILSNQELIMKALKIEIPVKKAESPKVIKKAPTKALKRAVKSRTKKSDNQR